MLRGQISAEAQSSLPSKRTTYLLREKEKERETPKSEIYPAISLPNGNAAGQSNACLSQVRPCWFPWLKSCLDALRASSSPTGRPPASHHPAGRRPANPLPPSPRLPHPSPRVSPHLHCPVYTSPGLHSTALLCCLRSRQLSNRKSRKPVLHQLLTTKASIH